MSNLKIHPSTTFDEYKALGGVNWSKLKHLRDGSPLHYKHAEASQDSGDTASRGMLRAVHCLVLEPETWDDNYTVTSLRRDGRTTVWKEYLADNPGRTHLTTPEAGKARSIAASVLAHPVAGPMFTGDGQSEVTVQWVDKDTGLACKGRIDRLQDAVIDLKTVGSLEERRLAYMMAKMGWHCQLAHYSNGAKAVFQRRLPVLLVAVESKPPHDVGVFLLDPESTLWAGEAECRQLLSTLAECLDTNHWPGRYPAVRPVELPAWAFGDDPSEVEVTHDD